MTKNGTIVKALSGFYYVDCGGEVIQCRARGKFRIEGGTPLVGDFASITVLPGGGGRIEEIAPRKNEFVRPPVSNIEMLVILASGITPRTDPFLIDCMTVVAGYKGVKAVVCVNKCDEDTYDELFGIYSAAGFDTLRVSALTGEGIETLRDLIEGKVCAFTGNSGVGKSSVLTAMQPDFELKTGEVSEKLGRGRHTTRHVELFKMDNGALVADTPGFSSFDTGKSGVILKEELGRCFIEFEEYTGRCRFTGCSHTKEPDCAVLDAVRRGKIPKSRHESYSRLYEKAKDVVFRKTRET